MKSDKKIIFPLLPQDSLEKIYQYLPGYQFIQMQLVSRKVGQSAQEVMTFELAEILAIPEAEKRSVWCIYECFRNLKSGSMQREFAEIPPLPPVPADIYASIRRKSDLGKLTAGEIEILQQANLLPTHFHLPEHAYLSFPVLPPPPPDLWAALRAKRYLREFTRTEIHLLFTHGLLDRYLLKLGKSDCEKAFLIMESSFLRARLPEKEKIRTPPPNLFSRVAGFFLFAILSSLLSIISLAVTLILVATGFSLGIIFFPLVIILCKCGLGEGWSGMLKFCRWGIEKIISCAILAVIYPIYCLFAGAYMGYKFGLAEVNLVWGLAVTRIYSYLSVNELLPSLEAIFSPPQSSFSTLIADMAVNAERLKGQDISLFEVGALSVPPMREGALIENDALVTTERTLLLMAADASAVSSVNYDSGDSKLNGEYL